MPGSSGSKSASRAQKGIAIPDEAKAASDAMSTRINSNPVKKRGKSRRKPLDRAVEINRSQIHGSKN